MPMVIPMMVSDARSLFRRTMRSAIRSADKKRESTSLVPEGGDGVHQGGPPRGEEAEDDPDDGAGPDGGDHRRERDGHRQLHDLADPADRAEADEDADEPAEHAER